MGKPRRAQNRSRVRGQLSEPEHAHLVKSLHKVAPATPAGDGQPNKADATGRDIEMYSLLFTDGRGENLIDTDVLIANDDLELFTKRLVRLGMLMTTAAVRHFGRTFGLTDQEAAVADQTKRLPGKSAGRKGGAR